MQELKEVMSTRELARAMDMAPITLEKWRREGIGPRYKKQGRFVRYYREDVLKWLREDS